jgi:hypothetical protein
MKLDCMIRPVKMRKMLRIFTTFNKYSFKLHILSMINRKADMKKLRQMLVLLVRKVRLMR